MLNINNVSKGHNFFTNSSEVKYMKECHSNQARIVQVRVLAKLKEWTLQESLPWDMLEHNDIPFHFIKTKQTWRWIQIHVCFKSWFSFRFFLSKSRVSCAIRNQFKIKSWNTFAIVSRSSKLDKGGKLVRALMLRNSQYKFV